MQLPKPCVTSYERIILYKIGADIIKLFAVLRQCKLVGLSLSVTSTLVYYLQARMKPTRVEIGLHAMGRVLRTFSTNIRLVWKWLNRTNRLAYYASNFFNFIKSFIIQVRYLQNSLWYPTITIGEGNPCWRERISTVDLLVLTSSD